MSIYDIEVKTIDGRSTTLEPYKGDVMLIVNTASGCGLTPQYKGLQLLYSTYREQGFVVLGFPCNQFAGQEPGTEQEIKQFCEVNYQVTFPMFSKIDVKGEHIHPLYRHLLEHTPSSEDQSTENSEIEWNFAKFLINRQGQVVRRFSARTEPEALEHDILPLLASKQ